MARVCVSIKLPGYEMVCTLVMIPEPRGQPLGVVEQLRHREGHLGHPQVLSSKITAPSECGSVQQLLSQWAAHDSLPNPVAPPSSSPARLGLLKLSNWFCFAKCTLCCGFSIVEKGENVHEDYQPRID